MMHFSETSGKISLENKIYNNAPLKFSRKWLLFYTRNGGNDELEK